MADQDIQFKVTADVQDAKQGFDEVQQKIDGVKGSASETVPVMDEVKKTMDDAGDSAADMGDGVSMLSEILTMGLVVGAIAGSIALLALAKDMLTVDSEVENLTAKLKEHWSETFKVNQEWERFREELSKFTTAELIESLAAIDKQVLSIGNRLAGIQLLKITEFFGITSFQEALQNLKYQRDMISKELFGTPDTLGWDDVPKDMQKKWKESFKEVKEVNKGFEDQANVLKMVEEQLERTQNKYKQFFESVRKAREGTFFDGKLGMGGVKQPKKPGVGFSDEDVRQQFLADNAFFVDTAIGSANILRNEFNSVWGEIFGEANSLFEKMIANWIDQLANMASMSLFGSLLNFFVPGLGTAAGMATGSTSSGTPIQNNIIIDGRQTAIIYTNGKMNANRLRMD